MDDLFSNTYISCQWNYLLHSPFIENSFVVLNVFVLVILDVNSSHSFVLLPSYIFLFQVDIWIAIIIIITTIYEGTLVSFWCDNCGLIMGKSFVDTRTLYYWYWSATMHPLSLLTEYSTIPDTEVLSTLAMPLGFIRNSFSPKYTTFTLFK